MQYKYYFYHLNYIIAAVKPSSLVHIVVGVLLILVGHVYNRNLLLFNVLLYTDCRLVVVHILDGAWYIVLNGSIVPLMI